MEDKTSSAIVAAEEYPAITLFVAFPTSRPPPPMMMMRTGRIDERIKASFQLRTNATIKPEKNVPIEYKDNATYYQQDGKVKNLIRDSVLN